MHSSVVIATALGLEFQAVERLLTGVVEHVHPLGSVYRVGALSIPHGAVRVAIVQCGAGNTTAALEAERAIQLFQPAYFMFVGVAGGIKDVQLGDVVAASKIYAYESGKVGERFLSRPDVVMADHAMLQRTMTVARDGLWIKRIPSIGTSGKDPRAFIGPIAAGEKVLAAQSSELFEFIRSSYNDALAVEMEGYGAMRAAFAHTEVRSVVVRGISDLIAGKAEADREGWQPRAACNAAAFAAEMISAMAALEPSLTKVDMSMPVSASSLGGRNSTTDLLPKEGIDKGLTHLLDLAPALYPAGPTERDVWSRAGGDISRLDLSADGRTAWRRALWLLSNGGGGSISMSSLVRAMRDDFPQNDALNRLLYR